MRVDLCDGKLFTAEGPKLGRSILAVLVLFRCGRGSPKALHSVIGAAQWMFLLNRPLFAMLDHSYAFTRITPELDERSFPTQVVSELVMIISLAPFFEADLRRT